MSEPNRSITPRGFTIYDEFPDTDGNEVCVQQASTAWMHVHGIEDPDDPVCYGPFLRVFCRDPNIRLTVEMATRLRNALDAWIQEVDHGSI